MLVISLIQDIEKVAGNRKSWGRDAKRLRVTIPLAFYILISAIGNERS